MLVAYKFHGRASFFLYLFVVEVVVAVSYTHLDVYKRQNQYRTGKGNIPTITIPKIKAIEVTMFIMLLYLLVFKRGKCSNLTVAILG